MKCTIKLLLLTSLFLNKLNGQTNSDYIINLNNDTVFVQIKKVTDFKIVTYANDGTKIKYRAKKIIGCRYGDHMFKSGRVCSSLIGFKYWKFLSEIIDGKISYYRVQQLNGSNRRQNLSSSSVFFYTLKGEKRGKTHKILFGGKFRKLLLSCDEVNKKFGNVETYYWSEIINYYNEKCK